MFAAGGYAGHPLDDDSSAFEGRYLVRIIGHQTDGLNPEVAADCGGEPVIAGVYFEAQSLVCFDGIGTFVLQLIGAEFVDDANAPPFFHFVDNEAAANFANRLEGHFQLLPAIATQAVEDIAGKALGVDAQERRRGFVELTQGHRYGLFPLLTHAPLKSVDAEVAKLGWEIRIGGVN